jgi:hypothetical protein
MVQLVSTALVWVTFSAFAASLVLRYAQPTAVERVQSHIDCLEACGHAQFPAGVEKPPCGEVCAPRQTR